MYEDSWYSFVPDTAAHKPASTHQSSHRRKESLLQQPNGTLQADDTASGLDNVLERPETPEPISEPTLTRRAASYSDFYRVVRAQIAKDGQTQRKKAPNRKEKAWEALMLAGNGIELLSTTFTTLNLADEVQQELLEESQREYTLYQDQLSLTERHLDSLVADANDTLALLTSLSESFQSVEEQTSSFQSKCEDLLQDQRRLEKLADEVGTDLYYYTYLDKATRRLNAPGASRLVDDDNFVDMLDNIQACVAFMEGHEAYRERDTYLARYSALLTKALHILDHGFSSHLDKSSADIGKQIAATTSDSAKHALAYGRFTELMGQSYALLPNVQNIFRRIYDMYGRVNEASTDKTVYVSSATNMLRSYLTTRDRDVKVLSQKDVEEYQKSTKEKSVETASRNYIKQSFERIHSEDEVFSKMFGVEPAWSNATDSVFQIIKQIATTMPHPGYIAPIGNAVQSALQNAELPSVCSVVGWLAHEYSIADSEEDEELSVRKHREYAARLLVEHLWPFTDKAFETEIAKSITKATLQDSALKIDPVVDGVSSSNAHPVVKRAIELLSMFDQAMPKERSSKNSSVVFSIVRETIQMLQKAEARISSLKQGTDASLFMVKNLLIVKNELVSLEIGDIRSHGPSMQHFGQIWDTLSPQKWVGFIGSIMGGSIWSRGEPSVTAKTLTIEDMSEQLDELLRQSIYAFTKRWASLLNDAENRKPGVKPIAKLEAELENILDTAFSNQPEVIAKLKEAIAQSAEAQKSAKDEERGAKRY